VGADSKWVARNKTERVCHVHVKGGGSGRMKMNVDAEWVVGEEDVRTKSTCGK